VFVEMRHYLIIGWISVALALFVVFTFVEGKAIGDSFKTAILATIGGLVGSSVVERARRQRRTRKTKRSTQD
jgi:membrane associated rhomboid family serine protease